MIGVLLIVPVNLGFNDELLCCPDSEGRWFIFFLSLVIGTLLIAVISWVVEPFIVKD